MKDLYKYNSAFQLVIDATGISSHNYNLNGNCISKTTTNKKGKNENFNEQKNETFCISHLCIRNVNTLRIHYYFIQFAHIIRQLLENGSKLAKDMKFKTKKEVSIYISDNLTSQTNSDLNNLEINFQLRFDDLILLTLRKKYI